MPHIKFLLSGLLGAFLGGLAVIPASAQYPTIAGSVALTSSVATTTTNSNVTLTCRRLDISGSPVSGESVVFVITSQPGSGASISPSNLRVTDSQGIATANLFVGTAPGLLVVRCEFGGLASQVLINVVLGVVATPPPPPPPAIVPPATGDAGLQGDNVNRYALLFVGLVALGGGLGLAAQLRKQAPSR